jgi:triosephosphate isomerase (TIM)
MKQIIIAGNWKSNKTVTESDVWFKQFAPLIIGIKDKLGSTIPLICGPFSDLYLMKRLVDEFSLPVQLGAQDVSPFNEGAYTGEVTAKMLKELVGWVIIGHSERRKLMHEADEELFNEVKQAKMAGLKVIYCVPDDQTKIPTDVDVVGYEPVWAIGTGKTDSPENANAVITTIKTKSGIAQAVYGGSITAENIALFVNQPAIDGALVGGASLDPQKFYNLIVNASQGIK